MEKVVVVIILAIVVEALVNLFFQDALTSKWKKYVAYAIGILFTVVWKVGVLDSLSVNVPNVVASYIDYVMTGIFVSRGSNFIHDIFSAVRATSNPPAVTTTTETIKAGEEPTTTKTTTTPSP